MSPSQYVDQLRQLVEARRAKDMPRDVETIGIRRDRRDAIDLAHCPELEDRERTPVEAGTELTEQNRAAQPTTDHYGDDGHHRRQQNQGHGCDKDVEEALSAAKVRTPHDSVASAIGTFHCATVIPLSASRRP